MRTITAKYRKIIHLLRLMNIPLHYQLRSHLFRKTTEKQPPSMTGESPALNEVIHIPKDLSNKIISS